MTETATIISIHQCLTVSPFVHRNRAMIESCQTVTLVLNFTHWIQQRVEHDPTSKVNSSLLIVEVSRFNMKKYIMLGTYSSACCNLCLCVTDVTSPGIVCL